MEHSEADLQELRDLGACLSDAQRSPWEPRCVARAFASPSKETIDFTMQAWIDLEAMRSPLLRGELPENFNALEAALNTVCLSAVELEAPAAIELAQSVMTAMGEAFDMAMPMKERTAEGGQEDSDGFGQWLPIFTCLVTQCGLSLAEARGLHVAQAYALIAAHRRNQGWREAGKPYALRDADLSTISSQPSTSDF